LFDGTFQQQAGEGFGLLRLLADNDAAGVKVVMQGFAFTQKFRAKDDVQSRVLLLELFRVADRHGGLDDQHRLGIDLAYGCDHCLDTAGVEVVGFGVVVSRRGDNDELGVLISLLSVSGSSEAGGAVAVQLAIIFEATQHLLDVGVFNG